MKVITEERLRGLCKKYSFINHLISECEEIDTLTVSKLRPMDDAPEDETILIRPIGINSFMEAFWAVGGEYWSISTDVEAGFDSEDCLGWIPMPIYKPEEK